MDSQKMSSKFIGPYPVNKIINPSAVRLSLPSSLMVHPVFHISLLKPVTESPLQPPAPSPPPPRLIEGHPEYTVDQILDIRRRGQGYQYLVDWGRYGPEEHSWISRSLILDPQLLRDFHERYPCKPARVVQEGGADLLGSKALQPHLHTIGNQAGFLSWLQTFSCAR